MLIIVILYLGVTKDSGCWLVRQVLLGYGGKFRNHPKQNQIQGVWGEISVLQSKFMFQMLYVVMEFVDANIKGCNQLIII